MTDARHRLAKMLKRLSYMLQIQKKQTDKQVFLLFCRISYVLIVLPTVSKEKGAAPLLEQAVYRIFISKTLSAGINVPGRYCKNGPAVVRSMICRPDRLTVPEAGQ